MKRHNHSAEKGDGASKIKGAKIQTDGLDLFSDPPVDTSLFGVEPRKLYPINDAINPVEFDIDNRERWLDVTRSYMYFHIRLTKTGAAWGNDNVGVVNNIAFSVFSHIEVKINGRQLTTSSPKSFAYIQWFQAFFNMSDDDKKTWGTLQGYLPIDSAPDAIGDNEGFKLRKIFTAADRGDGEPGYLGDQPFILPLNQIPALSTYKFFPPLVRINIKLYPFASNWPLMMDNALNITANVSMTEKPYLMLHHPMINPSHAIRIEKRLASATGGKARYVSDNVVMRDFTIPDNLRQHHLTDVVPPGPMPKRIVSMLQPQKHFEKPFDNDGKSLNPFHFTKNNLAKIETDGDGGFDEIDLVKDPLEAYRRFIKMFEATGHGIRIDKKTFDARYNMYFFDFTHGDDYTDPVLYKLPHGTQRFTLRFDPVTGNQTKAIFLLFYTSVLQLDMLGSVLFDDTVTA